MVGAFLGAIDGETRCRFWADDPTAHGFSASRLIAVDLARTPAAAAARRVPWSAVEVDDAWASGGALAGTSLGPAWPELSLSGVVYLAHARWAALPRSRRPRCPPPGAQGRAYEYQSVVHWTGTRDPRAGRRYLGHHAEVLDAVGHLAHVAIYPAGRSRAAGVEPVHRWLDLDDPATCDVGPRRPDHPLVLRSRSLLVGRRALPVRRPPLTRHERTSS
jgi:hypothetical protein